jgi:hypothetical protein
MYFAQLCHGKSRCALHSPAHDTTTR